MNSALIDLHLARLRNPPASNPRGKDLEKQTAAARMVRLDKAKVLRPYYLPFLESSQSYTILLDGVAGSVATRYTPPSSSDTLILGYVSNFDTLHARISDVMQNPIWSDFPVPARSLAGVSAELAGHHGYLDLEEPYELLAQNQLAIDVVNTTGGNTRKWFVAAGIKVSQLRDVTLDVFDKADVQAIRAIEAGVTPRNVDLFLNVPFTGGVGQRVENLNTKSYSEPLLIWGVSTTLKNCSIELWDSAEQRWMPAPIPIWAFANWNAHASGRVVNRLKKPVYHPAGVELRANFINTLDPALGQDPAGSVVFHCSTP